jgi:hypothetical protein
LASSPAKIASHLVSENSGFTPSFSATAVITSMSKPVSWLVVGSWNVNGE